MTTPTTYDELQALLPDAHIEVIGGGNRLDGDREELVIYTGWRTDIDGQTLIPMGND